MSIGGVWKLMLGLALCAAFLVPTMGAEGATTPRIVAVDDIEWNYDGCVDHNSIPHVVYSTQEGLMFADLISGRIENPRMVSDEDAQEASVIHIGSGTYLIAYIVEEEFFETSLRLIKYDGKDVLDTVTLLQGASYHDPFMAYYGSDLVLVLEQGGSGEDSTRFSSDIAMLRSSDDGETWGERSILFESIKDESKPSLAVHDGRLYISFVQALEEKGSQQGNAWEAEDSVVMVSSSGTSGVWTDPYRVSYDVAEVSNPTIMEYGDGLALIWATNIGEEGIENSRSFSCMLYDGFIWSDQIVFRTPELAELVPFFVSYADLLVEEGDPIPPYLLTFSSLSVSVRDPDISLSSQEWTVEGDTTNEPYRKDIVISNDGNSILRGTVEVPKRTDYIVVSASQSEFEVDPGEETMVSLVVELDRGGNYDLTVLFRSNDADNGILPFFIKVDVKEPSFIIPEPPITRLEIVSFSPQGNWIDIMTPITATFSRPILETVGSAFSIEPALEGASFNWSSDRTSVRIDHSGFQHNTTYRVTILKDEVQGIGGIRLGENRTWTFLTAMVNATWLLDGASVLVNDDRSVDVSSSGMAAIPVFIIVEGVGSYRLEETADGMYALTIPSDDLEWNMTYSYHFSNASSGSDIVALAGTFTTPVGDVTPPQPPGGKDEEDGISPFAIVAIVALLLIMGAILAVLLITRARRKADKGLAAEMAVFFTMLLLLTAIGPMVGSGQEAEPLRLIDEEYSDFARSRVNISSDMEIVGTVPLRTRTPQVAGDRYSTFSSIRQMFSVGNTMVDGIYFHAQAIGPTAIPITVLVKDISTQRVLVRSDVLVSAEGEYLVEFDNTELVERVLVEFSTKDVFTPDLSHEIRLGTVEGQDANLSEVTVFAQYHNDGHYVLMERFNYNPIALSARYYDPDVFVVGLSLDKKVLLLDKEGDMIGGNVTLMNNLDRTMPLTMRVVCYDREGREYDVQGSAMDLPPKSVSGGITFELGTDQGLGEGEYFFMIGLYYQGGLVYRFGDDPQEVYSCAFLVSHRRIAEVSVLPTDRIRPGGHFNVAVLKIDGIPREIDDAGVSQVLSKYRAVAQEYALSYDVEVITDFSRLTELMDSKAEDYAIINTHGSVLPLPDEYVNEFTGTKDTILLMHFNEYREKPQDSSSFGNVVENYPKSMLPDNAFWVPYDDRGAEEGELVPLFVNGLVELPARPDAADPTVSGLVFAIRLKIMDLPPEGDRARIAAFWSDTEVSDTFWSMDLWNSREGDGKAEIEVSIQDGSVWESHYFEMPYEQGFDMGEWTTIRCEVQRSAPEGSIILRVRDRFGRDVVDSAQSTGIISGMDSTDFDSLVLVNTVNNGSLSWEAQPLEACLGILDYYLTRGITEVDADTWEFVGTAPTNAITSFNGREGAVHGSLFSMNGVFSPTFRNAYYFLGDQWLEVVNNDAQKLSEFTIEFMMKMDTTLDEGEVVTILSKGNTDPTGYSIELEGVGISNIMRFGIGDGTRYHILEYGSVSQPAITSAGWHKVCAIYEGGDMVLQIDGREVAYETVDAKIVYDNSSIFIGGRGPEQNYLGLIDELIITKGFDSTNHNIKYADWLSRISTWVSSSHCVWVNPVGYPLGYIGLVNLEPLYYGDSLFKQLLAPLTHTPGEFLNSGEGATPTPQGEVLDDEFGSISLPVALDYDLACLASREGSVIPLYYDHDSNMIPAGAVKFGEGAYAFSTMFSPDITVALSMIRLPNDYMMNILNYEHYKGEDIIVQSHIVNPTDEIETYFVNLTVSDPFGKEYTAHSKNVTILPGKDAEVHLLFQAKKSTFPKGTYRLLLTVERMTDGVILDVWGDESDESRDLVINLIDDVELEILDHSPQISHNQTLIVPVRVINHGALPTYVNIELSVLSPTGGVFDVALEDRIMVPSHKSKLVELEWDPAQTVEEQSRSNLAVDLPFGNYKILVAMYDAESVLYTSSVLNQQAKSSERTVFFADDMEHMGGAVKESDGWSIQTHVADPGYLSKGTTSCDLEDGEYIAQFNLMIGSNTGKNEPVANVSVWFGNTPVAYKIVERSEFINPNTFQFFDVPFSTVGRRYQAMSFRTFWEGNAYLKQDRVEVIPYSTSERTEEIEMRTKPIDFEYSAFSILAETQITAFLTKENDQYVSAEIFYEVGEQVGSFVVPKTDQCYSFTLYHYPKDIIYITTKGLGGGKDMKLSAVRTTETFIIQKKGRKLIDVEHGYSGDVVDLKLTESTSTVMIKDTLTLEDLSVYNYTSGVSAGFDDNFSKPYVQYNNSLDWAEFEIDIPASRAQRLTIEAYEEPGKVVVLKCLINTSKYVLEITFPFTGGFGTWTQSSTNVNLASGHYFVKVSQQRDGYHARMYPEIFVTPLSVYDHGEIGAKVEQAGNKITVCILGLGFTADLGFIPKIPEIPIPGLEVPSLSIGDTLKLTVVDQDRNEVETLVIGGSYYLRIKVEYTHEMKDSKKDMNGTHKSGLKYNYKKASDRPGLESLTFIVGVEIGFVYSESSHGIRYPAMNSFGVYELGVKIKIRLKAWSNPGIFVLDIATGGSGSLTPGVSEVLNVVFGALRSIGFDIGAGLYLMIEATLIFKPHFKLIFNVYPLGEIWAKIVLNFWFFKFTIIDLMISLVLPIGLTVVADSGFSPWNIYITFFIQFGGKLVLFEIKIFNDNMRINLITIHLSKGTPKSRYPEIGSGGWT